MSKYWQITKTHFQRHLSYRARIFIWIINDSIDVAIFPFLWLAIYGNRQILLGYTRADIVTYYLMLAFISLTAAAHISRVVRLDVMEGNLNGFLLKPFNYIIFRILHELTYKIISLAIAITLVLTASFVLPNYIVLPSDLRTWVFFIITLSGAAAISLAFQFMIGLSSFWLGENSSLNQAKVLLETVFSGQIAPLVFFPLFLQTIASYLPFKYVAYFPIQVWLNQLTQRELFSNIAIMLAWTAVTWLAVAIVWQRGVRHYEGVGI